jgi:hypothetical protein
MLLFASGRMTIPIHDKFTCAEQASNKLTTIQSHAMTLFGSIWRTLSQPYVVHYSTGETTA